MIFYCLSIKRDYAKLFVVKNSIKIIEQEFDNYKDMESSAKNWEHKCTYQLLPSALIGKHQVLELDSIQLSSSSREGGMIHEIQSPQNTISVAVIQECEDKAIFGKLKLHAGDIIFFDDSQSNVFMSKGKIKFAIVSINKDLDIEIIEKLLSLQGYYIQDINQILSKTLENSFSKSSLIKDEIIATIEKLIEIQEPIKAKLTKGEEIALEIREQIYNHMDANICIKSLSTQHKVSEKTLQTSFKSLFGFTPKLFLRLLKLNLVHHELKNSNPSKNSVSKIAIKWGFKHMGSFSKYYTELFGENPSQTLKTDYEVENIIHEACIDRQEEIK